MGKRILFLDHVGVCGGAELSMIDLARANRADSHVVLLADGPLRRRLAEAGVSCTVMEAAKTLGRVKTDTGWWRGLGAVPTVTRTVTRVAALARRYDVIYANSQKSLLIAAPAGALARRPVVWALRDILTADRFSSVNRRVVVRIANGMAARVLANSHATAAAFVHAGGRRRGLRVVHNGIDPAPYLARSQPTSDHPPTPDRPLRLGLFGRVSPWKGQHVLIEALARVPGVEARIIGGALFGEHDYHQQLEKRIADLGLGDRVSLMGFREDVPALMRGVDVVVHCSTEPEPFGRVIVEGLLAGRAVIASRGGGVDEIVRHDQHALLVPPGDPQALAHAIARLRDQPALIRRLADAGRAHARDHFTLDHMVGALDRQLDELLAPRRRPPGGPAPRPSAAQADPPASRGISR